MKFTQARTLLGIAACCGSLLGFPAARAAVVLQANGASYVAWEAETDTTIIPGAPETWVVTNDATASGNAALYAAGENSTGTSPHSFAQYAIRFATEGTYYIYSRWRADAARTVADQFTANSSWIGNRFGAFATAGAGAQADYWQTASNGSQAPANNVYDWQRETEDRTYVVGAAEVAARVPLIMTVGTREAGMYFDRFVLSTDPNLSKAALESLANADTTTVVQGNNDTHVAFEAESKGVIIPGTPETWVATNDVTASAGAALYAAGDNSTGNSPHSFAQYPIRFKKAGTYYVYYRWRADAGRTVADQFTANSSWLGNRFGAFNTIGATAQADYWQTTSNGSQAPANNVYDWQRETEDRAYVVSDADVAAGVPLIITLGTREAGMYFDRFVLSPDANLSKAALEALPNSGAVVAGPELVKAVGAAGLNTARVFFTRPLAAGSVNAGRFQISGNLQVTAATLDAEDPRQVLLTTAAQTPGTKYTITVNGVTDTSGSAIKANSTVDFSAWKLVEGWATTEIYQGITGSTIEELRNGASFIAGTPSEIRWVKGFQLNNDPRAPNMGAKIYAFFSPQASGSYNFYMNNDDEAELLLSDNQSEAGLQSLGVFPLAAAFDDANPMPSPFSLSAGQKYLLEGLVHSSGGDVYLNVVAQPSTSSTPATELPVLGGSRISTYVNPDLGNVTFKKQPTNVIASAGGRAIFSANVEANEAPVYYQWQKDGVNIAGATRAAYTTPVLTTADSGKKYRVVVSVAGKDTTSAEATLTVNAGEPSNLQPYLGVNFVGGGDNLPGRLTSVEVAGVALQENWNNLTGSAFDQVPLVDASGAATPVTLSVIGATENWYTGTLGSGDANGALLQGFIDNATAADPLLTVALNNVPAGNYNVIVYSVGFPFQADYAQDMSVSGGGTYPTYMIRSETGLNYNANPAFRRMSSTSGARATGNYVQFDNVTPASDGSITINANWVGTNEVNGSHQPAVNAIQLVKVNPVTTRPTLTVARVGGNWALSWDATAAGFTLETSSKIGAGAAWTPVTGQANPLAGAGTLNVNTSTGTGAFFRLRK